MNDLSIKREPETYVNQGRVASLLSPLFWTFAVLTVVHRTWVMPLNPLITDDYTTVWSAVRRFVDGAPVYTENYLDVDPHYLYSPGGTLLLAPMTWFGDYDMNRLFFVTVQSAAIVAAIVILLRWFGIGWKSWVIPVVLTAAYHAEPVINTLSFTNVNGSLLLAEVLFLLLVVKRKNILAGIIIGLAITVKPVVAPLLFIPFMRKQWTTVLSAIAVPVIANAAAWPLMNRASDYVNVTMPYLGVTRDYFNSSLGGQLLWLGAPEPLILMWRAAFGLVVAVALLLLLRWMHRDEVFWVTTTAGLLMVGVFFLSSLGQQYYSMLILPMILSVVRPLRGVVDAYGAPVKTVVANWPAATGITMCFFYGSWVLPIAPIFSGWINIAIATIGWGIILLAIMGCMIRWTIEDHAAGIDWFGRQPATTRGRKHGDDSTNSTGSVATAATLDDDSQEGTPHVHMETE
ncbi:glycosyltransferase 87 family protein [Corynebacterium sp. H78]|uniref:glycosyltransferase 87 family protein n=1 Tax=Corynebacterium sp. H78 TaxID=3133417 RepID=UPI0030A0227B